MFNSNNIIPLSAWVSQPPVGGPGSIANTMVHYKTQLCDAEGNVEHDLQEGWNMITDWGMDQLATSSVSSLVNYLHLSDTANIRKRALQGGNTVSTDTTGGASNVVITAAQGFFTSADVGRVLQISGWPELLISAYADAQHVTCTARGGVWLPGFTPSAGPFTNVGIYYTNMNQLDNQFTRYNTYDTAASNYNTILTDSANTRFTHQRIFLSATVGSQWTVNQLGWSDGNGSNNVFGVVNLSSTDTIPVGKKYRVTLQVYSGYTPINLTSVSLNWGGMIGTYTCDISMERIGYENSGYVPFLIPANTATLYTGWTTGGFTMQSTQWQGDAGYTSLARTATSSCGTGTVVDGTYTGGTFNRTRRAWWPDTVNISGATGLLVTYNNDYNYSLLTIRPQSGTISKPSGYWCDTTWTIYWTRTLN